MEHPTATAELLARLVAFDTTSRNSNLALIGFVRALSRRARRAVSHQHRCDRGKGQHPRHHRPAAAGGIALSGHVDTVPVDGQAWSSDPFALRRADGRLYARGAAT